MYTPEMLEIEKHNGQFSFFVYLNPEFLLLGPWTMYIRMQEAVVRVNETFSEEFEVQSLCASILSPVLLIIVLEELSQEF